MKTLTADELREQARQYEQKAQDSFDRCDTDGFLSQWASGLSAQLCRAKAEITENGGVMPFEVLLEDDKHVSNRRVDAKLINGQFGAVWLLSEAEEGYFGRKFIPFAGNGKSRIQEQLGLREDWENAPAAARITGRGTGLSGNAWVEIYRTDGK